MTQELGCDPVRIPRPGAAILPVAQPRSELDEGFTDVPGQASQGADGQPTPPGLTDSTANFGAPVEILASTRHQLLQDQGVGAHMRSVTPLLDVHNYISI